MSFFNNVEKVAYKKETQDPVILLEYIKFSDEKAQEKYLLFKFKNVLTQQLKEMRVLVNLYDENHYLIGTTVFEHKNFVAKGLEEFVPTAKLLVHYNTKYIEVSVVKAVFDTLVWEENELRPLERVTFESDVFQERKTVKTSYRPKEDIVIPKGARKTKYKDVTKSNKVLFPKLLAGLLLLVLIKELFSLLYKLLYEFDI